MPPRDISHHFTGLNHSWSIGDHGHKDISQSISDHHPWVFSQSVGDHDSKVISQVYIGDHGPGCVTVYM